MRRLVVLLLAIPVVGASQPLLDAHLTVRGEASFQGEGDLEWNLTGSILDYRDGLGGGTFSAAGSIAWRLVEFDVVHLRVPDESGGHWMFKQGPAEVTQTGSAESLTALPFQERYTLRAVGNGQVSSSAVFRAFSPRDTMVHYQGAPDPYLESTSPAHFPKGGPVMMDLDRVDCSCRLIFFGAEVELPDSTILTGRHVNHSQGNPLPVGVASIDRYRILEADLDGSYTAAGPGWIHHVDDVAGEVSGDLQLFDAQGRGSVNGTQIPSRPHHFQVIGPMEFAASWSDTEAVWRVSGDPHFVAANAASLFGNRLNSGHATLLLAVGAGTLGLVGAAWLFHLSGAFRTRQERPLDHPMRAAIARSLLDRPGLSPTQLAAQHDTSRRTVRFHLDILSSAGLVSEYREGKSCHYTLNSGSSRFPHGGTTAVQAFSAAAHPIRQDIVRQAQLRPIDYASFAAGGHQVAARTFRYHCKILAAAGLLKSVAHGRTRQWAAETPPEELHRHYVRAFLVCQGWWLEYEAAQQGASRKPEIQRALAALGLIPAATD